MKPGTLDGMQGAVPGLDEQRSHNQPEIGVARESGLDAVSDEELEFFDTVGLESQHGADAFTYAGVRVRR